MDKIYDTAPISQEFKPNAPILDNPICIKRNVLQALKCLMSIQLDSNMLFGHSPYNHSNITNPIVCRAPHAAHSVHGIPIGSLFYEFTEPLTCCLTGDGGFMPRVPYGTPTLPVVFLRVLSLNDSLQHCRHSGICVLLSKLSDHDPRIENWVDEISADFETNGNFTLLSTKTNVYCIYKYLRTDNGDWSWSHKITTKTVGPTGKYNNTALVRWKNGEPKNVKNEQSVQYYALIRDFTRNCDDVCDTDTLKRNNWDGYRLITPDLAQYFALQTESLLEIYKEDNPNVVLNYKQERNLRKSFAYAFKHGYLYLSKTNYNFGLFDPNHMWWSWVKRILEIFFAWGWNVRQWIQRDYLYIASQLGVEWIGTQIEDYATITNPKRQSKISLEIKTNGEINKNIINGLPFTFAAAAELCDKNAANNNNRFDESGTTICCLLLRISSLMRRGFAVLLTDKFEMNNDNKPPDKITNMINDIQLATYLAYHLFDDIV